MELALKNLNSNSLKLIYSEITTEKNHILANEKLSIKTGIEKFFRNDKDFTLLKSLKVTLFNRVLKI